jgi:hypothetical protein
MQLQPAAALACNYMLDRARTFDSNQSIAMQLFEGSKSVV